MSAERLPVPAPEVSPEAEPYWSAAAHGKLRLQHCVKCGAVVWYPRGICPECFAIELVWSDASGRGVIYSYTIIRRGATAAYQGHEPYVLAYVELEEGPRVMSNIVDVAPLSTLRVGLPVVAVFESDGDATLVRFRPA